MYLWKTIKFPFTKGITPAKEKRDAWLEKNQASIEWHEVFANNAYAIEYRKLRCIG